MARSRNREGIPMIVALSDERRPLPVVEDADVLRDGAALADRFTSIRRALAPSMPDADNGGVISALVTVAHTMADAEAARG